MNEVVDNPFAKYVAPEEPDNPFAKYAPSDQTHGSGNPFDKYLPQAFEEPEPVEERQGRLSSAASSFMQSLGQVGTSIPKSAALAMGGVDRQIIDNLNAIDEGRTWTPRTTSPGMPGLEFDISHVEREYMAASPERRKEIRSQYMQAEADVLTKSALYSAGRRADEWMRENFPTDPEFREEFWAGKVPAGLGSATGFIGTGLLTRGAGAKAGLGEKGLKLLSYAGAAGTGASLTAVSQFEDALSHGADISTAMDAAKLGALIGTTEAVPIGNLLNRIDQSTGGSVKRYLVRALKQGTEEAVQEAFAGIMNNAVAAELYDPERGIWDVGEDAAVGVTTGAILETVFTLALGGRRARGGGPVDGGPSALDMVTEIEEQARKEAAEAGGDALDQAMAAAEAVMAAGPQIDEKMLREREDAEQREMAWELFEAEQEEQKQQDFDSAEAQAEERKQAEAKEAEYQRELQIGEMKETLPDEPPASTAMADALKEAGADKIFEPDAEPTVAPTTETATEPADLAVEQTGEPEARKEEAATEIEETLLGEAVEVERAPSQRETDRVGTDLSVESEPMTAQEQDLRVALEENRQILEDQGEQLEPAEYDSLVQQIQDQETQLDTDPVAIDEAQSTADSDEAAINAALNRRWANPVPEAEAEREAEIEAAANEAATSPQNDLPEPTEAQIEAGNYKKGHINFGGLDITVENPKGSTRSGKDASGKQWSVDMKSHYGYVKRTEGADGDQVDVFVGPNAESEQVYIVDQIDQKTDQFDEHKVMLGYNNKVQAVAGYKENYEKGWKVGKMTAMTTGEFKEWLRSEDTTQPADLNTPTKVKGGPAKAWARKKIGRIVDRPADVDVPGMKQWTQSSSLPTRYRGESFEELKEGADSVLDEGTQMKLVFRRPSKDGIERGIILRVKKTDKGEIGSSMTVTYTEVDRGKTSEDAPDVGDSDSYSTRMNAFLDLQSREEMPDRFEAEDDWDGTVGNFTAPKERVNAVKEAGPYIPKTEADARLAEWKAEALRMGKEENHKFEVVISLFDESGEISKPWEEAGYTVIQMDIKLGDDLLFQTSPWTFVDEIEENGARVVALLAQPPCTCFSGSGARWREGRHDKHDREIVNQMFGPKAATYFSKPKDYTKALVSMVDLWIETHKPDVVLLENPVGRIAQEMGLPEPTLTIQPHLYGDPYTKKTNFWGRFNPHLPTANVKPEQGSLMHKLWSDAEKKDGTRSVTPEGFAYAFFMANKTSAEQGQALTDGEGYRGYKTKTRFRLDEDDALDQTRYPGFYSAAMRALAEKLPNKGSGKQMAKAFDAMQKKGGFKGEEAAWLELQQFVADKDSVTKEEVLLWAEWMTPDLQDIEVSEDPAPGEDAAQYTDLQAVRGENYRETLITLPKAQGRFEGGFKSSHFAASNVIAHARSSEVRSATGESVLMVQEVQSDWHQKGRQMGYMSREAGDVPSPDPFDPVSDAPFKKSWSMLAMKRMIKDAVKNGHSAVAFPTGRQQAITQGVVQRAGAVEYNAASELVTVYDENGQILFDEVADPAAITSQLGERLAQSVQDAVSEIERVRSQYSVQPAEDGKGYNVIDPSGELMYQFGGDPILLDSPEELRFLGLYGPATGYTETVQIDPEGEVVGDASGMEGFYDNILPNELNKYLKQWGVKVSDMEVTGVSGKTHTVHGFEITDAMRQDIEARGQPLFRSGGRKGPNPLTVEETQAAMQPIADELPALPFEVIQSIDEAPQEVQDEAQGHSGVKGVFHDGQLYIVSDAHSDPDDVIRTALHEGVGHYGLEALFGDQLDGVLDSIYQSSDPSEMGRVAEQYGLNLEVDADQRIAAEEYVASLAERNNQPMLLQRLVARVRDVLRKLGLVKSWTDNDIHSLLAQARTQLKQASQREQAKVRFSLDKEDADKVDADPDSPLSVLYKMSATAETQSREKTVNARSILENAGSASKPALLGAIPRRHLPDIAPDDMPAARNYIQVMTRMEGRRTELLSENVDLGKKWLKFSTLHKNQGRLLADVMHAATLSGVDPSKPYTPRIDPQEAREEIAKTERRIKARSGAGSERLLKKIKRIRQRVMAEKTRAAHHQELVKHWNKLNPEGKAIYRAALARNNQLKSLEESALQERVNASDADDAVKATLLDMLRQHFEQNRVEGPYFTLARFGKYWALARDSDGQVISFSKFRTRSEQQDWVKSMSDAGYKTDAGRDMKGDGRGQASEVNPAFVTDVEKLLDKQRFPGKQELMDDIWQMYLKSLPEMSMRKHQIHRKGQLGFTEDALRAWGHYTYHAAHQIARLEHGHLAEAELKQLGEEARAAESKGDNDWAAPLYNEIQLRHEAAMNPQVTPLVNAMTKFGFLWFLGATPAAAMVNLTQTPIVGLPVLSAKHGWGKATAEMTKMYGKLAKGGIRRNLRGDEAAAYDEFVRVGVFDKTQAHDLAGISEEGVNFSSKANIAMEVASWMFHQAELWNREITAMAAYRLGRADGMSHEQAILHAEALNWDSHFDYSNANRPRYIQGQVAKPVLLFMQHSINMAYRLTVDFKDSIQGAKPEVRREARTRFAGILGMTFLFAGATGLPLYWLAEWALNLVFDDEDEPLDVEAAVRTYLTEQWGESAADIMMHGVMDELTGVTISTRVSLNNLWIREMRGGETGEDWWLRLLGQLAGPLSGTVGNFAEGIEKIREGKTQRGIEKMVPKAVADLLKAYRYVTEGATNLRGDPLLTAEELGSKNAFIQALGFTPAMLTKQYELNNARMNEKRKIEERRRTVLSDLALALESDNQDRVEKSMAAINRFNRKNPRVAIDGDHIDKSLRRRGDLSLQSRDGIYLGEKYLHLLEKYNFKE